MVWWTTDSHVRLLLSLSHRLLSSLLLPTSDQLIIFIVWKLIATTIIHLQSKAMVEAKSTNSVENEVSTIVKSSTSITKALLNSLILANLTNQSNRTRFKLSPPSMLISRTCTNQNLNFNMIKLVNNGSITWTNINKLNNNLSKTQIANWNNQLTLESNRIVNRIINRIPRSIIQMSTKQNHHSNLIIKIVSIWNSWCHRISTASILTLTKLELLLPHLLLITLKWEAWTTAALPRNILANTVATEAFRRNTSASSSTMAQRWLKTASMAYRCTTHNTSTSRTRQRITQIGIRAIQMEVKMVIICNDLEFKFTKIS